MIKQTLAAFALTFAFAAPALAVDASYNYSVTGNNIGGGAYDRLDALNIKYSTYGTTQKLDFSAKLTSEILTDDGFWLVVNNGPNPKGVQNELAILYGDVATKKITAYAYNGANNQSSYSNPGIVLATFNNAITLNAAASTYSFSLDVSGINSLNLGPNWTGAQFTDSLGIWFHMLNCAEFTYSSKGIKKLVYTKEGYFDANYLKTTKTNLCPNGTPLGNAGCGGSSSSGGSSTSSSSSSSGGSSSGTTPTPAPGALGLLIAGLGALAAGRRRRAA